MDCDNVLKLPIDFLCAKKYNTEWLSNLSRSETKLYTISSLSNLGIDDQYIQSVTSSKTPHRIDDWELNLIIEIIPLTSLNQ